MQTIPIKREYEEKIDNYVLGDDYQPLMINMEIRPPLYLSNPYIYLDGILSYLCLRDALGELFWNLPTKQVIDISNLQLPFKKTSDVWHASIGIMNKPLLKRDTIYKRFTDKEISKLKVQKQSKVRINAGYFKDFMINNPLIVTDNVKFYCNGDKKELKRLLCNHLTHLGKKTSIGGGLIKKIKISETETDYSFFKDNTILKPIPPHLESMNTIKISTGATWAQCTYKPPYWDNSQVKLCRKPPNQLIGEPNNA